MYTLSTDNKDKNSVTLTFSSKAAKIGAYILASEMALGGAIALIIDTAGSILKVENRYGQSALILNAFCYTPRENFLWRASKAISCPMAAGANMATAVTGPLTGTPYVSNMITPGAIKFNP